MNGNKVDSYTEAQASEFADHPESHGPGIKEDG